MTAGGARVARGEVDRALELGQHDERALLDRTDLVAQSSVIALAFDRLDIGLAAELGA